jgi:TetR/AcrR family transcriptional regulator, transcriptional repressor for nem operon
VLTTNVRAQLNRFTSQLKGGGAAGRQEHAIMMLAGMVGALTLVRAVDDPALSNEILATARKALSRAIGLAVSDLQP